MGELQSSHLSNYELWKQWKEDGSLDAKKKLIELYVPLVDFVVNRMAIGLPRNVSRDDLHSHGVMGLMDAVSKFDLSRGLQFETYASWRIRGAIIDALRSSDWVPRSVREKSKRVEEAYHVLEQKHLRSVTDAEVCEYLQISEKEFNQLLHDTAVTTISSFDDPIKDEEADSKLSLLVDENAKNPIFKVNQIHQQETLAKAIERLTEKERIVVSLFYFEELSLSEIAEVMSLSPSRISQLHSKAILRLRGALGRHKDHLMND
jgi:RNA polymerase sigma factor for flagellar operon FliA